MIIQLIYWESVCKHGRRSGAHRHKHTDRRDEELAAFERVLARLRGRRFIRYR